MLFVTNSVQLVQRIPYQGSFGRVGRLQNRLANHSHCEICRSISNLYMAQSVKVRLNRGETRSVKIGRGGRQGCCLSPILFNLYSEYLNKEALEGLGDFKIGGQIIHTVKYADRLATCTWFRVLKCD